MQLAQAPMIEAGVPALVLAPMSGEDQPTIRDLAAGANEGVALAAADTRRIVGNHGRQDQLGATRAATHRLHSDQRSRAELHSCSADIYRGTTNKGLTRSVRRRNSGCLAASLRSHKREARDDLPQPLWQSITRQIRELHSSRWRAHLE